MDLYNEMAPSLQIDAIDISLAQCPPQEWLPRGIKTVEHDIYAPVPESMQGVYDLVHVANWLCIWRDATSEALLKNLTKMLRMYFCDLFLDLWACACVNLSI